MAGDPNLEWIGHVQPVGLVVAPAILSRHGLNPSEQTRIDSEAVRALLSESEHGPALADPWAFFHEILDWRPTEVAGALGGPPLPLDTLSVDVEESDTELRPDWAVSDPAGGFQLLVRIEAAGIEPDQRGAVEGWAATPHQRLERLCREADVPTGLLLTDHELRLIHAPRGETSGWISFPLRSLGGVAGRPMLGGLKLLLSSFRLHNDAPDRRLPALLKASREAQAEVSAKLAGQVLGALHELLRGLHAADRERIEALAARRPDHLYDGLLAVLLRLVFLLYAEDRDLIPSLTDGDARRLYESYGARALHARLLDDIARHEDTMDERRGAWPRLLVLFRLVHRGHASGFIIGRGGKLFDPAAFPFLQGQEGREDRPDPAPVSDGCIFRVLDGLLTLDGERLSYRTLDVEQIGSVYETVMGFTVETRPGLALALRAGKNDRTPVFVDVVALAATKGGERKKFLKEEASRHGLTDRVAKPLAAAADEAEVVEALRPIVDKRGSPGGRLLPPGTPLLQPTDERRRTGSHYTPRSLTEPIVRHALEPAFERIGQDARPEAVLDLKLCDPAMGSGAFLVEACRQLAARLVKAWARWPETRPRVPEDEDEELHARRLVAQRCLYGVDKNPRAVELAKLSLWLATLAREHEFTFLDHALKCGDSLVGLDTAQIATMHWDASKPGLPLFRKFVADRIAEATKARAEIQSAPDDTVRAVLEKKHQFVESQVELVRVLGDAVISAFLAEDKAKAREKRRVTIESWVAGIGEANWDALRVAAASLRTGEHPVRPFHWAIEFPEAFDKGNHGFDAFVGNPPFSGGTHLEVVLGRSARDWIVRKIAENQRGIRGAVDLSAYFFLRCFSLLNPHGAMGLVATNSISQGDTRLVGLQSICNKLGLIYRAVRSQPWPGEAATHVSVVWVARRSLANLKFSLDGKEVETIDSTLGSQGFDNLEPAPLDENRGLAFEGVKIAGVGFIISRNEAQHIILKDVRYADVICDYLTGDDVNSDSKQRPSRCVISFMDWPLNSATGQHGASDYPEALRIVEERVKPDREKLRPTTAWNRGLIARWWQFGLWRPALHKALRSKEKCFAISRVTAHHCFAVICTKNMVFSDRLVVVASDEWNLFSALSSRVHHSWAHRPGSTTQGTTLNYFPSRAFLTFPRPEPADDLRLKLAEIGVNYHDHRAALMVARHEGMTKTYNRFHDPDERSEDIVRLRELHAEMDRAVLSAYGWDDLAERAEPIFLDETNEDDHTYQGRLFWPSAFRDEVLARLLALNAERHAEEVRLGLAKPDGLTRQPRTDEAEDELEGA